MPLLNDCVSRAAMRTMITGTLKRMVVYALAGETSFPDAKIGEKSFPAQNLFSKMRMPESFVCSGMQCIYLYQRCQTFSNDAFVYLCYFFGEAKKEQKKRFLTYPVAILCYRDLLSWRLASAFFTAATVGSSSNTACCTPFLSYSTMKGSFVNSNQRCIDWV